MRVKRTDDPRFGVCDGQKLVINIDSEGYKSHLADRENFIKMKKAMVEVENLSEQVKHLSMLVEKLALSHQSGSK